MIALTIREEGIIQERVHYRASKWHSSTRTMFNSEHFFFTQLESLVESPGKSLALIIISTRFINVIKEVLSFLIVAFRVLGAQLCSGQKVN